MFKIVGKKRRKRGKKGTKDAPPTYCRLPFCIGEDARRAGTECWGIDWKEERKKRESGATKCSKSSGEEIRK